MIKPYLMPFKTYSLDSNQKTNPNMGRGQKVELGIGEIRNSDYVHFYFDPPNAKKKRMPKGEVIHKLRACGNHIARGYESINNAAKGTWDLVITSFE